MSRWIAITEDHLKAAGHSNLIDSARDRDTGGIDPVVEAIADAVARVRRAVSAGNVLDADASKVPGSMKAVTVRLALYALSELIGLPLTDDQSETRRADTSDLNRITDYKLRVEAPDDPAANGEMQAVGRAVEAVNVPRRLTGRRRNSGL